MSVIVASSTIDDKKTQCAASHVLNAVKTPLPPPGIFSPGLATKIPHRSRRLRVVFRRLIMKSSTHHTNAPRNTSGTGSQ